MRDRCTKLALLLAFAICSGLSSNSSALADVTDRTVQSNPMKEAPSAVPEPSGSSTPNAESLPSASFTPLAVSIPAKPSAPLPAPVLTPSPSPTPSVPATRVTIPQLVLPLPGSLDSVPVFNSNSPEIVLQPGVLLSTFPGDGRHHPEAHLNYPLQGRFDVFFHHIINGSKVGPRTLYLGMLIGNSSDKKVHVQLHSAISYATKPDSPFITLDPVSDNKRGKYHAGPGDRVTLDQLRDKKQHGWHRRIELDPGEIKLVYQLPLRNGRTGALKVQTDGPVYLASLAASAKEKSFGREGEPELDDWKEVLDLPLAHPRDKTPSVPGASGSLIFGRVAGVSAGSSWQGYLTNDLDKTKLSLSPGTIVSYPISTIIGGTHGTKQVQAAPMLVRYSDTAYQAHGNYGLLYDLTLPLYNSGESDINAGLCLQTPLKDWNKADSLQFFEIPPDKIFFRGTIKFEWIDEKNKHHKKLIHLVQKQGQRSLPLIKIPLKPKQQVNLDCSLVYPADCTPPQVLTVTGEAADKIDSK
jgi:Protein of unknown function (DUF3370)